MNLFMKKVLLELLELGNVVNLQLAVLNLLILLLHTEIHQEVDSIS